jgi:hypothetical protein
LLLLATLVFGLGFGRELLEVRGDLSLGKPWVTSSTLEQVCASPLHHCGVEKGYFFHTQEEASPWIEIDLQREERFSALRVFNRQDCCDDRAVPLVIEVSTDHQHWREVVRKTETFGEWKAKFAPISARWVRLRIARRSLLHLFDVRVLR